MTRLSIAGLQIAACSNNNLDSLERETARLMAIYPWVQMVVLPELAAYGPDIQLAEPMSGPAEQRFCRIARAHGIWLLPGSIYVRHDDKIYNTTPVINPAGEVVARYRKRFPFEPYETGVTPGAEAVVFDVPGVGRLGVSICYDQWFPEVARELAWLGAEVIVNPTLTTTLDRTQELVIAQASAIFNQCYYININQTGGLANGRSICVGPEGDILHQSGQQPEFIPLVLDLERVRQVRRMGTLSFGQLLKSFRDAPSNYACYGPDRTTSSTLEALGPVTMPHY
jgi:predicted amidohydrolase